MKTELTPDQINVAIAELCGWKLVAPDKRDNQYGRDEWKKEGVRTPEGWEGHYIGDLPDYHGDLNAIAQAEATLTPLEKDLYACRLTEALNPSRMDGYGDPENGSPQLSWPGVFTVATATAAQRARAFLAVKQRA